MHLPYTWQAGLEIPVTIIECIQNSCEEFRVGFGGPTVGFRNRCGYFEFLMLHALSFSSFGAENTLQFGKDVNWIRVSTVWLEAQLCS